MIDVSKYEKVGEYKDGRLHWLEGRDINAVYLIKFKEDFYIGSAEYLYTRIKEHTKSFLKGEHVEKMQAVFDKEGEFEVYVIEKGIDADALVAKEMSYIRKLKPALNTINNQKSKNRIRDILAFKGITQKELAEQLGMSLQQLNNTVSGRNTASMAVFERIAEALGVEFWQLFAPADEPHLEREPQMRCPYCGHDLNIKVE